MTLNMAKRGAKTIMIGTFGGAVLLVLWLGISSLPLDFGSITIEADANNVSIRAPLRNYDFFISDIESIELIDTFPSATRINAAIGNRLLVGQFNVTGYGAGSVFVHRDSMPIIVIKLHNNRVFLNEETQDETITLYNQLASRGDYAHIFLKYKQ